LSIRFSNSSFILFGECFGFLDKSDSVPSYTAPHKPETLPKESVSGYNKPSMYGREQMKRRQFDADTKMAIVLEGLRGEISVAELCRKYQIAESVYYKWRDKFLEGGRKAFLGNDSKEKHLQKKITELEHIIGKQAVYIEILKKTSNMM
jgi:transposase-like protein